MPDALALGIARTPPEKHHDHARHIRHGDDEPGRKIGKTHSPHDLRQPQSDAIIRRGDAQEDEAERHHARIAQSPPNVVVLRAVFGKPRGNDVLLLHCQPWGAGRSVGQHDERGEGKEEGGQAFDKKQPLPAVKAIHAVHPENDAGERAADNEGERNGDHERCREPHAIGLREPDRKIIDHAGREARFRHAEEETQDVEADRALNEGVPRRDRAPNQHHAENPAPRADARQDDSGRHLEEEIADEKHARAGPENHGREAQILVHGEGRETDIHAVDAIEEINQRHERDEPPGAFGEDLVLLRHRSPR